MTKHNMLRHRRPGGKLVDDSVSNEVATVIGHRIRARVTGAAAQGLLLPTVLCCTVYCILHSVYRTGLDWTGLDWIAGRQEAELILNRRQDLLLQYAAAQCMIHFCMLHRKGPILGVGIIMVGTSLIILILHLIPPYPMPHECPHAMHGGTFSFPWVEGHAALGTAVRANENGRDRRPWPSLLCTADCPCLTVHVSPDVLEVCEASYLTTNKRCTA